MQCTRSAMEADGRFVHQQRSDASLIPGFHTNGKLCFRNESPTLTAYLGWTSPWERGRPARTLFLQTACHPRPLPCKGHRTRFTGISSSCQRAPRLHPPLSLRGWKLISPTTIRPSWPRQTLSCAYRDIPLGARASRPHLTANSLPSTATPLPHRTRLYGDLFHRARFVRAGRPRSLCIASTASATNGARNRCSVPARLWKLMGLLFTNNDQGGVTPSCGRDARAPRWSLCGRSQGGVPDPWQTPLDFPPTPSWSFVALRG